MKKSIAMAAILSAVTLFTANADIKVNFAQQPTAENLIVSHTMISDLTNGVKTRGVPAIVDTIPISGASITIPVEQKGDARYKIILSDAPAQTRDYVIDFYTSPNDNLTVAVESTQPMMAQISGSPLMDGIAQINRGVIPIYEQLAMIQSGQLPEEAMEGLSKAYDAVMTDFIDANPTSPAAVFALISIDNNDLFTKYEPQITANLSSSPLFPFLAADKAERKKRAEMEKAKKDMTSGQTAAPAFTLKDINGKDVSLAQFKGKWVVLDFWGSWCIWCIKGFPEMKEAYKKYDGKLEILGIDCGDTVDAWKAAVKKYQLPWVNLYNPSTPGNVAELYPVQGFPTKVIINPQGKIESIVTGESPEFYHTLDRLIK